MAIVAAPAALATLDAIADADPIGKVDRIFRHAPPPKATGKVSPKTIGLIVTGVIAAAGVGTLIYFLVKIYSGSDSTSSSSYGSSMPGDLGGTPKSDVSKADLAAFLTANHYDVSGISDSTFKKLKVIYDQDTDANKTPKEKLADLVTLLAGSSAVVSMTGDRLDACLVTWRIVNPGDAPLATSQRTILNGNLMAMYNRGLSNDQVRPVLAKQYLLAQRNMLLPTGQNEDGSFDALYASACKSAGITPTREQANTIRADYYMAKEDLETPEYLRTLILTELQQAKTGSLNPTPDPYKYLSFQDFVAQNHLNRNGIDDAHMAAIEVSYEGLVANLWDPAKLLTIMQQDFKRSLKNLPIINVTGVKK
jgi:hypothetical protein